jgi:membrane protease YdiL (CAAX protease family)
MRQGWIRPTIGVLVAIAITTAMDANGLSAFSALPLFPLMVLLWYLERRSRAEMGFIWGRVRYWGIALIHPAFVLNLTALFAWIAGAINLESTDWQNAGLNFALVTLSTIVVVTITEEGFFRGWLWTSLKRAGQNRQWILVWSSLAFAGWHLSAILLETGFNPPLTQAPMNILNAFILGAIWGVLRLISNSVVVASVGHGIWNGITYVFFGFGAEIGALGIKETAIYGPEVGILGLVLNLVFVALLWQWYRHESTNYAPDPMKR